MSGRTKNPHDSASPPPDPVVEDLAEYLLEAIEFKGVAPEDVQAAFARLIASRTKPAVMTGQGEKMGHLETEGVVATQYSDRAAPGRPVPLNLSVSSDLDGLLNRLSGQLGITKADAILRGIALLKAATDAKRDGKFVGSADSPDVLETEFVGFY